MLQVTRAAMAVLKEARSLSGASPEAGLRLHSRRGAKDLEQVELDFQKDPEPADQRIEVADLRVFVSAELVEPLSHRVLDVNATPQGPELTFRWANG